MAENLQLFSYLFHLFHLSSQSYFATLSTFYIPEYLNILLPNLFLFSQWSNYRTTTFLRASFSDQSNTNILFTDSYLRRTEVPFLSYIVSAISAIFLLYCHSAVSTSTVFPKYWITIFLFRISLFLLTSIVKLNLLDLHQQLF